MDEATAIDRLRREVRGMRARLLAPIVISLVLFVGCVAWMVLTAGDPDAPSPGLLGGVGFWGTIYGVIHVRRAYRDARGATAPAARGARYLAQQAVGGAFTADPTSAIHGVAMAEAALGVTVPSDDVPGLDELVDDVAARVGLPAPKHRLVVPEAWVVRGDVDAWELGAGALVGMPLDEYRAAIARHLVLSHGLATDLLRSSRRLGAAAAALSFGGWLAIYDGIAVRARPQLERATADVIGTARAAAGGIADGIAGPGASSRAIAREQALLALWDGVLGVAQDAWAGASASVRPMDRFRARVDALAPGEILTGAETPFMDPLSVWDVDPSLEPHLRWQPAAEPSVSTVLGLELGAIGASVDEAVAAAYYEPLVATVFGPLERTDDAERAADELATLTARLTGPDPADELPMRALVERQITTLDIAAWRRLPTAPELARVVEGNAASPAAELTALAVAWRSGDPAAARRISDAVSRAPWSAPVLSGLVPALRRAGEVPLADAIDSLTEQLGAWVERPFLGAPPSMLAAPTHGPVLRALVRELAQSASVRTVVWIVNIRVQGGAYLPSIVMDPGRMERKATRLGRHLHEWQATLGYVEPLIRFAYPDELGSRARRHLDRVGERVAGEEVAARAA